MLTLIKNEYIKIFKRSKTWVVVGLFVLLVVGMGYIFKLQSDEQKKYQSLDYKIEDCKNMIENYQNELESSSEEDKEYLESEIQFCKDELKRYEELKASGKTEEDWREYYKEQIEVDKVSLEEAQSEEDKAYFQEEIDNLNYYLENDIKPIESWEMNGTNYLLFFMTLLGTLILVCGIAVFMSDIVSGECTPPTLKFLLVQPISRGKVLLSKFIAITTTTMGLIGVLEGLAYGVLGLIYGVDANKMRVLTGVKYKEVSEKGAKNIEQISGTGEYISYGKLLLEGFGLQMLFIVTCCAFIFLISCLFKSSMITMAISVVSTVGVTMVMNMSSKVASIAHYIFISYGNPVSLLQGNLCYQYQNVNVTTSTGIIVMIVTIVLSYAIGHIVFKKKDILI